MNEHQLQFALDFWTKQLRLNPEVTDAQAKGFRKSLETVMGRIEPAIICSEYQPLSTLRTALKAADIADSIWPKVSAATIFDSLGIVHIWENKVWRKVIPK